LAAVTVQLRKWTQDKLIPLFTERSTRNVAIPSNSIANLLVKSWYAVRKLVRKACNKLACMADIPTAVREEEAGP
jgi:hypothetical protein